MGTTYHLSNSLQIFAFLLFIIIALTIFSNKLPPPTTTTTTSEETSEVVEEEVNKQPLEKMKDYKLIITEDGVIKGPERLYYSREGYIIGPDLYRCYEDGNKPEYCSGHAPKSGWAYMYDIRLGPTLLRGGSRYTQCPDGGGHGCWYVEKYVDGKLTMIRNSKNIDLAQIMADDLWTDRWNLEDPYIRDTVKSQYKLVEVSDGDGDKRRLDIYKITKQQGQFVDVKMTPANSSTGLYLTYLLLLLRLNGEEKPKKVQLDIKGIRLPYEGRP